MYPLVKFTECLLTLSWFWWQLILLKNLFFCFVFTFFGHFTTREGLNKTSLILPLFIAVPVPSQESGWFVC